MVNVSVSRRIQCSMLIRLNIQHSTFNVQLLTCNFQLLPNHQSAFIISFPTFNFQPATFNSSSNHQSSTCHGGALSSLNGRRRIILHHFFLTFNFQLSTGTPSSLLQIITHQFFKTFNFQPAAGRPPPSSPLDTASSGRILHRSNRGR